MYTNPCNLSLNPANTGIECQSAMLATAMQIMVPRAARWTQADIDAAPYNGSFTAFVEAKMHLPPAQRWYPLGGFAAPINSITESNETDVVETLDDGSSLFVRYGKYNRTFLSTAGGLCFADHLMRFPQGYSFIEVDQEGKKLEYEPTPGVFGGVPLIMFKGLAPTMATFSTVYKNRWMMVFDPVAYVQNGRITSPGAGESLLTLNGLLDTDVSNAGTPLVTGATAPTGGTTTITAIGVNGDSIQISINGVDVSGTVIKTSSESTVTLLAAKIVTAINALTATNGGISATNSAGVTTYVIPATYGATLNTLSPVPTIVGTIAASNAAFSGGINGIALLLIDVNTECADTDLVEMYPTQIAKVSNFIIKDKNGNVVTATAASIVNGHVQLTIPAAHGPYTVQLNIPSVLRANGVEGYEGTAPITIALV